MREREKEREFSQSDGTVGYRMGKKMRSKTMTGRITTTTTTEKKQRKEEEKRRTEYQNKKKNYVGGKKDE